MITLKYACVFLLFPMLCMVFCVAEDFLPFTSYLFHLVLVELLKEWGLKGKTSKHDESSIFVGRFK